MAGLLSVLRLMVYCLIIVGALYLILVYYALFNVLSGFAIILTGKRELVALLFIVFLMPCDCECFVFPCGDVGWTTVTLGTTDSDISLMVCCDVPLCVFVTFPDIKK